MACVKIIRHISDACFITACNMVRTEKMLHAYG